MAIATWAALKTLVALAPPIIWTKSSISLPTSGRQARWSSQTLRAGTPAAQTAPTTSAALSYSTDPGWSMEHPVAASGTIYCIGIDHGYRSGRWPKCLVVDRLVHQGGIVMNITSSQTTNLPTAALPSRATGGAGVQIGLQVYTAGGSTDTTITVTYTNQAGTGSRTAVIYITTNSMDINQFFIPSLQNGDTGVRSVESIIFSASTGTAGNMGIVLFKPLILSSPAPGTGLADWETMIGWNMGIADEAVLDVLPDEFVGFSTRGTHSFKFAEA